MTRPSVAALALLAPALLAPTPSAPLDPALVDSTYEALAPVFEAGSADGSVLTLDFEALYAPLGPPQRAYVDSLRALSSAPAPDPDPAEVDWVRIEGQVAGKGEDQTPIPLQLLPTPVWRAYEAMSRAMEQDVGRRLLVGSGYRSSAYQVFVLVAYLKAAGYSMETALAHVSLPGESEHGLIERQGIDFVNADGVDLRYADPERFAALPEYAWLQANAARFGFALSFPRGGKAAFAPWHWHYSGPPPESG